jgi:hypothetical protein
MLARYSLTSVRSHRLDEPDLEIFESLPEWLQDKIKGNLNYAGSALQAALGGAPTAQPEPEAAAEADGNDDNDDDCPY